MRATPRRLLFALFTLSLIASACGGGGGGDKTSDTSSDGGSQLSATLNGAGSSFQNNFELPAIDAFAGEHDGVTINYNPTGSAAGKNDLANGVIDYAGSDSLVKPEELANFKGGDFLYFPVVAAPITVSYNVDGIDELKLSADTIAKIFQRQVKTWDDPAIAAENPDATLPSTAITVVHRADGSGTTSNFTKYLTLAAPGSWTLGAGDTVAWPADTQAGQKNAGVAQVVKQTAGAIGYVDYSDAVAAGLKFASIKNKAGSYVAPTLEGASAAVAGATVADDLTYSPLDAAGADAYPITLPSWVLTYVNQKSAAKGQALKAFIEYLVTDGQDIASNNNYAPIPDELATKAIAQLDKLVIPAS